MIFLLIIGLIFLGITLFIFYKDPRTLFLGVFSVLTMGIFGLYIAASGAQNGYFSSDSIGGFVLLVLLLMLVFLLLISPAVFIITLITKGVKLIKREGLSLKNLLSLVLGLFLLLFPMLSSLYIKYLGENMFFMTIYRIGMFVFSYIIIVVMAYTISSFINSIHFRKKNLDYVVVLGSGLNKDKVTPLLAGRINKGIEVYNKNKNSKLIMSGGKGTDEIIAESEAMRNYAIEKGISEEEIIIENKSRNTRENILFSKKLMQENSKFAIVTNNYHLFRALLTAKSINIKCIGYGSKTKLYFSLNAFIREIIGYFYLKRKLHMTFIALVSLLIIITAFITKNAYIIN